MECFGCKKLGIKTIEYGIVNRSRTYFVIASTSNWSTKDGAEQIANKTLHAMDSVHLYCA